MAGTTLYLTDLDAGMALTSDEFASADYKAPFVYERVKGRLVVMSPAGAEHRAVSRPFRKALGLYWGQHDDVIDEVDIEGWVATSEDEDRIPDICVYLNGEQSGGTVPRRVPELIFEFVSRDRADQECDYIAKRAEYHAIGVREYVIVDRFKRAALVLTHTGSGDFAERSLAETEVYTTPLLPGLEVKLAAAFGESKPS
ncbi:MAG: Uma2 family endonuclease [Planctomycetales bacterium]|nr:Uma2 family endonuclease [Planctomycetales bacterium]